MIDRLGGLPFALLIGLLVAASPAPATAQQGGGGQEGEAGPPTPPDTAAQGLVFRREVFTYPPFERRNPFTPLLVSQDGPRFEQIVLQGVIYSEAPGRSVALLSWGGLGEGPEGGGGERVRRIRAGESWGNTTVLEIRPEEVVVEVNEFGVMERRILRMPIQGQGGS